MSVELLRKTADQYQSNRSRFKISDIEDFRLSEDVLSIKPSELKSFADDPDEEKSKYESMGFAFRLGITDTLRGLSQITGLGFDEDEMKKEQRQLYDLMEEHGGLVKGAYFAGALLDPATWLIPFAKAKSLYQMAGFGMVSGSVAGAAGYVDEESFLNTRTKQIGAGAIGGGIVAPGFGLLKNLGVTITGKGKKIPLKDPDRLHKMNFTADDADKLKLNPIYLKGRQVSPNVKELVEGGFKGKRIVEKAGPERLQYIRPSDRIPYTRFVEESDAKNFGIKKEQFPEGKVSVRSEQELDKMVLLNKNTKGRYLKGPRAFFNRYVAHPYREKFGNKLWSKISTTGEGGLSAAGGAIGFTSAYSQPTVSVDEPFSSKLGAAFLGAVSGYLTGKYVLKTKMSTVKSWFSKPGAELKTKIGQEGVPVDFTFGEFLARGFLDNFTRDYKLIKQKSVGLEGSIVAQYDNVVKNLDRLSAGELAVVTNLLEGDITNAVVKNKTLEQIAKDARDVIQNGMQLMVDYGYLKKSTLDRNINRYLSRLYLDNDRIDVKTIADSLRARGHIYKATPEEYINTLRFQLPTEADGKTIKKIVAGTKEKPELINHRGWELPEGVTLKDLQSKAGIQRLKDKGFIDDNGLISLRWELSKTERLAKEEIEDAALLINQTMRIQSSAIGDAKFYDDLAKFYAVNKTDKKYAKLSEEQMKKQFDLYKIPTSKIGQGESSYNRYGNLAGKYVPKEVFISVLDRQKYRESSLAELMRPYRKLHQLWKASKTAWNPTVHVNNVMGNFFFTDFADVEFRNLPEAAKMLARHNSDSPYKSEIVHLARKYGVFDAGFVDKELRNTDRKAFESVYKYDFDKNEWHNAVSISRKLLNLVKVKKVTDTAENLYRLEDHIFRLNAFIDRLQKGYTADEAALFARKQFIDYDIQAPVINALRHTVTPFLAFTYRVIPILAETAVLRPWKFAKYGMLGYALNKAGEMFGGGDPEKERAAMEADVRKGGKILNLGIMPYKNLKLPFTDSEGQSKYIFIERFFPGGDVFEMGNGPLPFLPAPLQFSGGIYGDVITSLLGYDLFTGREVEGRGLSAGEDISLFVSSLASKLIPNFPFLPGSYATKRIDRATRGQETIFSEKESEFQAILNSIGIKVSNESVQSLQTKMYLEMNKKANKINKKRRSLYRKFSNGEISKAKYDREESKYAAKLEELARDYGLRIEGYEPKLIREPDILLKLLGNARELDYKTGQEYREE